MRHVLLVTFVLAINAVGAAASPGLSHYYDFGDGYLSAIFDARILSGELGTVTESGRAVAVSNRLQLGCFAVTPPLSIKADAKVDVAITYEAAWQGWSGGPEKLVREPVFFVEVDYNDASGFRFARGAAMVLDLGQVTEVYPPKDPPGLGYYAAATPREKTFSIADISILTYSRDFKVGVCHVSNGSTVTVKRIQVKVRHGEDLTYQGPASYEVGVPATNLIACEDTGVLATGCSIRPLEIAGPQLYETDFRVRYLYRCIGSPLDVFLHTDIEREVRLQRALTPQDVTVSGREYLRLNSAYPSLAHAAYVMPDCELQILEVKTMPSSRTLDRWRVDGKVLAEILHERLLSWALASAIDSIRNWDDGQLKVMRVPLEDLLKRYLAEVGLFLEDVRRPDGTFKPNEEMPPRWQELVDKRPELVSLQTLLGFIDTTTSGRPPIVAVGAIEDAATRVRKPLAEECRARVMAKYAEAQLFVERLRRVKQTAIAELDDVMRDVEMQLRKSSLLFCEQESCNGDV